MRWIADTFLKKISEFLEEKTLPKFDTELGDMYENEA